MRSRTLAALWAPLALFGCGGFMRLGVIAGAHQLFERGECAQLLQRAGSSSSLFEGHPELRARLSFLEAQCLSRMQRESEARALYRYLIEQHPTTPEAYRARALAGVVNILDPDVIVLGGGVSNVARLYEEVPKRWRPYVFSDRVDTRLVPPRHGDASGVRGAAWLWGR